MKVIEKSRRPEYSAWYSKDVERVVFYVEDEQGVQHFLHHHSEGNIPEYDKKRYADLLAGKVKQYKENGGEWIDSDFDRYQNQFSHLNALGPIKFIEKARENGWKFQDFSTLSYCKNGNCWMFNGNFEEVSAQFYYIIYTKELADKIRLLAPEVRFVEDDEIIL